MKKSSLINTAILACMIPGLASCHFLEVERTGKSDIATYFSEITSLEPAIYGVYNSYFNLFDKYMTIYPSVASDEIILKASSDTWMLFHDYESVSSDDATAVGYIWKQAYSTINNANQILFYGPKLREEYPYEKDLVDRVMAQAYFVRALCHFDLCRVYGQNYSFTANASHIGVPVVDHILGLTEKISRSSVAEVYSQIISDLEKAASLFPEKTAGRQYFANYAACKALLARVYLYKGDFQKAESYATEALSFRDLVKRDDYVAMFRHAESVADDECYFRLNGYGQGKSTYNFFYYESPTARPSKAVTGLMTLENDIRASLQNYGEYGSICTKYYCTDETDNADNRYVNPIVIRASEMYLIRAEARCQKGELNTAADDIKALRSRATGAAVNDISVDSSSKEALMKEISDERVRELCFEGHRFFDLGRWHEDIVRADDSSSHVGRLHYPDYRYVLQIPQVELEANEFIKNNPTSNE